MKSNFALSSCIFEKASLCMVELPLLKKTTLPSQVDLFSENRISGPISNFCLSFQIWPGIYPDLFLWSLGVSWNPVFYLSAQLSRNKLYRLAYWIAYSSVVLNVFTMFVRVFCCSTHQDDWYWDGEGCVMCTNFEISSASGLASKGKCV